MDIFFSNIKEEVKRVLTPQRFEHSLRVAYEAKKIATLLNLSSTETEKAKLAGILHDLGKELSNQDLLAIAKKKHPKLNNFYLENPATLHGMVGAIIAQGEPFLITDQDVLRAIANHTFGHHKMNLTEKIIFVADYVESSKTHPAALEIKEQLYLTCNIDTAVVAKARSMLEYALAKGWPPHPALLKLAK